MNKIIWMLFLFPAICFSETSLWEVSKKGNSIYLGGTIHVLKKEDYPLPVEFSMAFKKADKLVFETDIAKAQTPKFAQKMSQVMTYSDGKLLKDVLNKKTYKKLEKYLAMRNVSIDELMHFKPSMIVLVMTIIELKRMGMVDVGVDQFFHEKAKSSGKLISYFETVEQQINFLSSMGEGNEDEIILSTIKDMSQMESMMSVIKSTWLKGDEKKMAEVSLNDMMRDYPELYQMLLVKRNNNWMPKIEKMLKDKKVEMILVGALHLVGKDGLLQQLRNKGYTVKQFKQ